tara:strand:- start:69 stop:842 length:774 start_codon:yes stop_codon:yes gene_type:complete
MFKKIDTIFRQEGVIGFYQRIRIRFYYLFKPKIVKSAYGVYLNSNWGDATFNLCFNGTYGYFFSDFLKKMNKKYEFIDIGANQGIYSLIAAKNRNFKKIFAFEPVNQTFELLKKNIKINKFKNIIAKKYAISTYNGNVKILIKKNHSGSATIKSRYSCSYTNTSVIKTANFSVLNKLIKSDDRKVIKIDVEGHELEVVNQLIRTNFIKLVDFIYVEINFKKSNLSIIKNKLKKNNFYYIYKSPKINNHCDFLFKRIK